MYVQEGKDLYFMMSQIYNLFEGVNDENEDKVHFKITWKRKQHDITKCKQLEHNFGQSIVAPQKPYRGTRQTEYNLKEKISEIIRARYGMIRLWKVKLHKKIRFMPPKMYKMLEQIANHQYTKMKAAQRIPFNDLIHMLKHMKNMYL